MRRVSYLQKLTESGVVAVVRANSKEEAITIIDAIVLGGINAIEITYTIEKCY